MAQQGNRKDDSSDEEPERRGSTYYRVLVEAGNAQWWASLGTAILVVGLIMIALAYSTLQIISTIPPAYVGVTPSIGFQAYSAGIVVAAFGFVLMLYSRYKLARLSWIK